MPKDGLLSGLGLPLRVSREDEGKNGTRTRRTPLATMLVDAGFVTVEQIEDANAECTRTGERLGEVIVRHGWATEEDVARLLAEQFELPFLANDSFAVEPEAGEALSQKDARLLEACPIGFMDGALVVAIDDAAEARFKEVRGLLGDKTLFVIVTPTTLKGLYDEVWTADTPEPDAKETEVTEQMERIEPAPELDTAEILEALDALETVLTAGATAAADVRSHLGRLVETSAATQRELEEHRARFATHDETRRQDLDRIAELEAELARRTQFVDDLRAKLGDVVSGLEAAG
jgi:regulator of replication initiation timing